MSQNRDEIPRQTWRDFLDSLTKERESEEVTIEALTSDFGDQQEADRIPLAFVEYDGRDDVVIVAVGGRSGRYPVVLRHIIERPRAVFADPAAPNVTRALEIVGEDGTETIVTFHQRPALSS